VADVAWLTGTVLVLVSIGWLTVMIRDRRTTQAF
jgi:hypothetical protein